MCANRRGRSSKRREAHRPREDRAPWSPAMKHRGPDDTGYHRTPVRRTSGDVAAGDPRRGGERAVPGRLKQGETDQAIVLVYNGEIYNYVELREELKARGHALPNDLRHRGAAARLPGVGRRIAWTGFNGMFAFAILDYGQRPAVRRARPGGREALLLLRGPTTGSCFASEVKAILTQIRAPELNVTDEYESLRVHERRAETLFSRRQEPAARPQAAFTTASRTGANAGGGSRSTGTSSITPRRLGPATGRWIELDELLQGFGPDPAPLGRADGGCTCRGASTPPCSRTWSGRRCASRVISPTARSTTSWRTPQRDGEGAEGRARGRPATKDDFENNLKSTSCTTWTCRLGPSACSRSTCWPAKASEARQDRGVRGGGRRVVLRLHAVSRCSPTSRRLYGMPELMAGTNRS